MLPSRPYGRIRGIFYSTWFESFAGNHPVADTTTAASSNICRNSFASHAVKSGSSIPFSGELKVLIVASFSCNYLKCHLLVIIIWLVFAVSLFDLPGRFRFPSHNLRPQVKCGMWEFHSRLSRSSPLVLSCIARKFRRYSKASWIYLTCHILVNSKKLQPFDAANSSRYYCKLSDMDGSVCFLYEMVADTM